jgi:hydrogenase expression/formation protein HypE
MAILGKRNELDFSTDIVSDCASLDTLIAKALTISAGSSDGSAIRFMRDATRGGLATVLCEVAHDKNIGILLDEFAIPVRESVMGLCELLGFDPLYVANEGKVVMIVAKDEADKVIRAMRKDALGKQSVVIGEVVADHPGTVILETEVGGRRIVDMLSGAQLPRIC